MRATDILKSDIGAQPTWRNYAVNEEAINTIEIKEDETHYQLLNFIKTSFAYESEIMAIIAERKDPMDTIKTLENLSAAIIHNRGVRFFYCWLMSGSSKVTVIQ